MDEATYKRYRRLKHPELHPIVDKVVRRNRHNPPSHNFAQIKMAAFHMELTEELVIQVTYSFARVIEHNPVYLNRMYELLEQAELTTMPDMAVLINN